ncbi:MAG: hypothetical protein PVJ40_01250 [Gammaproteobacteria bacterium]|jgi:hypothetical protein
MRDSCLSLAAALIVGISGTALPVAAAQAALSPVTQLRSADNGGSDRFGYALAADSQNLVVGAVQAPGSNGVSQAGAVYFYQLDSNGDWQPSQRVADPDNGDNDYFGRNLALTGSTVFVFANGTHYSGTAYDEAVYAYTQDSSGAWQKMQTLVPVDAADGGHFCPELAASGNTLVVSASTVDSGGTAYIGAYVYTYDSSSAQWVYQTTLRGPDASQAGSCVADTVALQGDTAMVGAGTTVSGGQATGAVYVFNRNASTNLWTEDQILYPASGEVKTSFGERIVMDGDFAAVSASFATVNSVAEAGQVYIFQRDSNGQWQLQLRLSPPKPHTLGIFGNNMLLSGDKLYVDEFNGSTENGADGEVHYYVHDPSTGAWARQQTLLAGIPSAVSESNDFGSFNELALSGSQLLIGADRSSYAGKPAAGAVWRFEDGAPSTNLAVTQSADKTSVTSGGTVTFTSKVTNNGGNPATHVLLRSYHPLIDSSQMVYMSGSSACQAVIGWVECDLGDLAAGASTSVSYTIRLAGASSTTGQAIVYSDQNDSDKTDNSDSVNITIAGGSSGSSGSGGGGALGLFALLGLAGFGLLRARRAA